MGISNAILGVSLQMLVMLLITCIQTFFYGKVIGFHPKWKGLRLAFVVLMVVVITTSWQLVIVNVAGLTWTAFLIPVIFILYPVFFMGGMFIERVLFGFAYCAMFMFSALITKVILFRQILLFRSNAPWLMALLYVGLICAGDAFLVVMVTRLSVEGKRYMPRTYWVGLNVGFSVITVGLYVVDYFNAWMRDAEKLHRYLAVFTLAFLVIWLMLYLIFYFVCRYFTKAGEAHALAIQNDMIERYILRKQASEERIQILNHDLKHSLAKWRALAEEKCDTDALQSIAEYEGQLQSSQLINVENENANAIINQKCWEAAQQRVVFVVAGVFYKDLHISKLDLCSLLGNLLDNAVEAAVQAEDEALRRVKLCIRRKGNLLILVAENGYALEPVVENGVFVTGKKDKDLHAFGMRSIRLVAEKYDGVVDYTYENKWFTAIVMLRGYPTAL